MITNVFYPKFCTFQIILANGHKFIKVFHENTNMAILTLLPTLYSHIISSFLFNLPHMMLVNVKLGVSGYMGIISYGSRLHWSSLFLMVHLKLNWQYWHYCIAESL